MLWNKEIIIFIIIGGVVLALPVFLNAICWKFLLNALTLKWIPILEVYDIYAKANIGKYLPGNIMHYASRNIYGVKYGIKQVDMVYSTVFEILLKVISATIVSFLFLNRHISSIIESIQNQLGINIKIVAIIIALMVFTILVLLFLRAKTTFKSLIQLGKVIIIYSFIFFINAMIFIGVTFLIQPTVIESQNILYAAGIYIMAWLIGYLTPGAPGGVGIKESIMIILLSNIYTASSITLVSLITRIINVIGDLIAYGVNMIIQKRHKETEIGSEGNA
jgi:hypothetical protein